jgi:DNA helicase HerA-like ATPase
VSTLEAKGIPSMVQRTLIRPPASRIGPITPQERAKVMAESPVSGQYDKVIDRESAFEILQKKAADGQRAEQAATPTQGGSRWTLPDFNGGQQPDGRSRQDSGYQRPAPTPRAPPAPRAPRPSNRQTVAEAAIKSVVRSVGTSVGRAIVRGILGSLTKR